MRKYFLSELSSADTEGNTEMQKKLNSRLFTSLKTVLNDTSHFRVRYVRKSSSAFSVLSPQSSVLSSQHATRPRRFFVRGNQSTCGQMLRMLSSNARSGERNIRNNDVSHNFLSNTVNDSTTISERLVKSIKA